MDVLVDTNVLYYAAGIQPSDFEPSKISLTLSTKGDLHIIDATLIEAICHFDALGPLELLNTYMMNNKYSILFTFAAGERIYSDFTNVIFNDHGLFLPFRENVIKYKKACEVERLEFIIASIIGAICKQFTRDGKLDTPEKERKYAIQSSAFLQGNRREIRQNANRIVESFYAEGHQKDFAAELLNWLGIYHFAIAATYEASVSNRYIGQTRSETDTTDYTERAIVGLQNRELLFSAYEGKPNEFVKDFGADYVREMKLSYNAYTVEYLAALLKKVFVDRKTLDKNDLLDSHIVGLYDQFDFYTYDRKFKAIIQLFDPPFEIKYNAFITATRKR